MDQIEQQLRIVRIVRTIFLCVAAPLIVVGLVLLVRSVTFLRSAERAEAVVTNVESHLSHTGGGGRAGRRRSSRVYTPTFTFEDASGRQHVVTLKDSSSGYDYAVGEQVTILYDPADPQSVRVPSFMGTWGATVIVLGLGLGAGFFGVMLSAGKSLAKRQAGGEGGLMIGD